MKWHLIRILGLILGVCFLAYIVTKLDPKDILNAIIQAKWWFVLIIANSFLWYFYYTAAWRNYFSNLTHQIPFLRLLRIKISGEAVNLITPLGFIAGDPVRFHLLKNYLGTSTRMGSVIVDRLIHSLAAVTFVFIGLLISLIVSVDIPREVQWGLLVVYFLLISLLSWMVIGILKGKGLNFLNTVLFKLGLFKRFTKLEVRLIEMNRELESFSGGRRIPLIKAYIFHFFGRILGAVEIAIIFTYLDNHPHFFLAVILASLTTIVHFMFVFIPGGLGLVESMYAGIFYYYGLNPSHGISMQLIRRVRAIFWVIVGMTLIYWKGHTLKSLQKFKSD